MDMPFDRLDAATHSLGDLLLRNSLEREQIDRGSLPVGQLGQGLFDSEADFCALHQPGRFGMVGCSGGGQQIVKWQSVERFTASAEIERQIGDDPHQPRPEGFGLMQFGQIGEGFEEGILGDFQGILQISEKPIRNSGGPALVSVDQLIEG